MMSAQATRQAVATRYLRAGSPCGGRY